jgi:hypothetical protein
LTTRENITRARPSDASKKAGLSDGNVVRFFSLMLEPPLTYCTSFLSLRQYAEELYGAGSFKKLREQLRRQRQVDLPPVIAPGTWLPTAHYVAALEVAQELFAPGVADFCERFGAKAAEYELKWMHRVVLRFTSPVWLLERGREVWQRSHDTGRWDIQSQEQWLRGTLHDFAGSSVPYCASLRGWLTRTCQMTGAHQVRVVETACRATGGAACVFEGTW